VVNVVKFVRREIGEIVRYLPHKNNKTKFRLPVELSLLHGSRPKSAKASRNNVLTVLQISSKSVHALLAELYIAERVNTVFCPVEYLQDRLFEPIKTPGRGRRASEVRHAVSDLGRGQTSKCR